MSTGRVSARDRWAAKVIEELDLPGKRAIVTGGTSGPRMYPLSSGTGTASLQSSK